MTQRKKNFAVKFLIAFACAAALICLIVFVFMRGMFCNAYIAKGNAKFDTAKYSEAIKHYETAGKWKKKKQDVYLCLAKTYCELEDFDKAGKIIDYAIENKITTKDSGIEQLHIMRIKIFSAAGKLSDAENYINALSDQYIVKKIHESRPKDLTYSPMQGSYDVTLKMTIEVREGETVYYTTDGSYPTKFSAVYTEPIKIVNGITKVNAISVNADGLISPLLTVNYEVTNQNEEVDFDDLKIEQMVRNALSKPYGVIRVKELASITELSNADVDGQIRTLSDLELMPNLEALHIYGEQNIVSISNISGKPKLKSLTLANCALTNTDINALGSLSALETLDLSGNMLTSVSALGKITTLKSINVDNNKITDLSVLASNKEIEYISAANNSIAAIPDFESAEKLEILILQNNHVSDLSTIHRLTALETLDLSGNIIRNAKNVSALTNLSVLLINDNPLTNFDFVSNLTKLNHLNVSSTGFINLEPLLNLNLSVLDANDTNIASLSGIERFTSLSYLAIANTDVSSIAPIASISSLDYLDISGLTLSDADTVLGMSGLLTLIAKGHNFENKTFANPSISIVYSMEN